MKGIKKEQDRERC